MNHTARSSRPTTKEIMLVWLRPKTKNQKIWATVMTIALLVAIWAVLGYWTAQEAEVREADSKRAQAIMTQSWLTHLENLKKNHGGQK